MKYEDAIKRIEEITKILDEDISLEEGIKLYAEGLEITEKCVAELNEASGKITEISVKLNKLSETDLI